jgi:DNA repair protein RAD50
LFVFLVGQQRTRVSQSSSKLNTLKHAKQDAEYKLENLEKLRVLYEEHQKLVSDLIPAAERSLEEHSKEHATASVPYDDVFTHCSQAVVLSA